MRAIVDASPIIAFFDELRSHHTLLLLRDLGYALCIPQAVREEITKEPAASLVAQCIADVKMTVLPALDSRRVRDFRLSHPALGTGESEVILSALEASSAVDVVCILDEGPARRVAQDLGLTVIGTIGVLNILRNANLITEAEDRRLRKRLHASSFRIGTDILHQR